MRRLILLLVSVIAILGTTPTIISGAAGATAERPMTKAETNQVRAVIAHTLAAPTLRLTHVDQDDPPRSQWFVLQRPDRSRTQLNVGGSTVEWIQIGRDLYASGVNASPAGRWVHQRLETGAVPGQFRILHALLTPAAYTSRRGALFGGSLTVDHQRLSAHIRIKGGYVVEIRLRGEPFDPVDGSEATFALSEFGTARKITAPPAGLVDEALPAATRPTTVPIVLTPPADAVASAMQFRPVLADGVQTVCPPLTANPPAGQSAVLSDGSECFSLGPALLELSSAAAVTAAYRGSGRVDVVVEMDATGSNAFDRMAAANLQKQIAIVMFGRVLSAPTILTTQFGGRFAVSALGLTVDDAARIKAALVHP